MHPSPSFPLSHNVSLPVGLLSVTLDLCPSPSFPLSHNVSLPVGLFHGRGRCHRSCPLVSSHNTWAHKAHALASENPAPKLPQQWSSLDSLQLLPRACQHYKGLGKPHQMAASANHKLGGCVIQLGLYLIDIVQKNYRGGFRVIGPFNVMPELACVSCWWCVSDWHNITGGVPTCYTGEQAPLSTKKRPI